MTKFVLNSGAFSRYPDKAKRFFAEIVDGLGSAPKMLVVLFPQPRENWESWFAGYQKNIGGYVPDGVEVALELAFPATLAEQASECDIIYIPGGDDHLTKYWFSQFDVPAILEGKVVATSSAGSDILAAHYWACDWRGSFDGLGIVPIKFLAHYNSDFGSDDAMRGPVDWSAGRAELAAYGDPSLPIHALEEGDFVVVEQ